MANINSYQFYNGEAEYVSPAYINQEAINGLKKFLEKKKLQA